MVLGIGLLVAATAIYVVVPKLEEKKEIRKQLDAEFESIRFSDNEQDILAFMKKTKDNEHQQILTDRINTIHELRDLEIIRAKPSIDLIQDFYDSYPNSKNTDEVRLIEELIADSVSDDVSDATANETNAWNVAVEENTVASYENFINQYSQSKRVAIAELRIADLNEEALWIETKQSNTIEAYQDYLKRSIKKKYKDEAERKIKILQDEERKKQVDENQNTKTDDSPANDDSKNDTEADSEITDQNNSEDDSESASNNPDSNKSKESDSEESSSEKEAEPSKDVAIEFSP